MAFVRPTLAKLIARAKSDIETRLPGADAQIRRTVEFVLARVVGGAAHGLHGHLVWIAKQLMPDTAVDELMVRWADIWGLERTAAVKATGTVSITGVDTSVCPAGTLWQTADEVVYEQDTSVTIGSGFPSGTAEIDVTAEEGGADGNQVSGVTLSLVSPVTGIDTDGAVDANGLTGGSDQETLVALLVRLLLRLRTPPSGGGPGDYVNWALEVAGCTRAWQLGGADGLGTVALYFVRDGDTPIIPDQPEIDDMQDYQDSKAPVTSDVTVYAPTQKDLDITFTSLSYTGTLVDVKAAITAELEDLILRFANPTNGTDLPLSQINEAISIAAGETDHVISVPAADFALSVGEIPKLDDITWP